MITQVNMNGNHSTRILQLCIILTNHGNNTKIVHHVSLACVYAQINTWGYCRLLPSLSSSLLMIHGQIAQVQWIITFICPIIYSIPDSNNGTVHVLQIIIACEIKRAGSEVRERYLASYNNYTCHSGAKPTSPFICSLVSGTWKLVVMGLHCCLHIAVSKVRLKRIGLFLRT